MCILKTGDKVRVDVDDSGLYWTGSCDDLCCRARVSSTLTFINGPSCPSTTMRNRFHGQISCLTRKTLRSFDRSCPLTSLTSDIASIKKPMIVRRPCPSNMYSSWCCGQAWSVHGAGIPTHAFTMSQLQYANKPCVTQAFVGSNPSQTVERIVRAVKAAAAKPIEE